MAKRILVPLDRSRTAEGILPLVVTIARGSGAAMRLLLVEPAPATRVGKDGRVVAYVDQEQARLEAEGLDYLRALTRQCGGVNDVECVVRFGDPVAEILREAEELEADLIAVTTEGRSALGRAVLGSVAEQIVKQADASVMLVRPGRHGH
jgi:nucleotide-binding universal stress UspA family protein